MGIVVVRVRFLRGDARRGGVEVDLNMKVIGVRTRGFTEVVVLRPACVLGGAGEKTAGDHLERFWSRSTVEYPELITEFDSLHDEGAAGIGGSKNLILREIGEIKRFC
tara:strand:- start:174 stop:497 length:324 start_codon:yes stop_codon:yes gene_type:complete